MKATPVKKCTKCGEEKQLTEFCRQRKSPDGLRYQCKACAYEYHRQWNAAHPWAKAHPEKIREWQVKLNVRRKAKTARKQTARLTLDVLESEWET